MFDPAMIQAVWSSSLCLFTKKVNLKNISDSKYEPYERILTFEGPDYYSRNGMILTNILISSLKY